MKLKETFEALLNLEEILETLKQNKRVTLSPNKATLELISLLYSQTKQSVKLAYERRVVDDEVRRPDSMISKRALRKRKAYDEKMRPIFEEIKQYLEELDG